ncbi:hypothetical protein BDY24DRAFT_389576 [Mrakia frigida]|uniref:Sdh6p n=1 Tax=Mrakia frigida TaxID=29902 RepID=UPI003FCC087F
MSAPAAAAAASTANKVIKKRPISGLQREVLSLYKRSLKMTLSKPLEAQPNFLLLTRYNFRHPPLTSRDVAAIEHQIRLGNRTLELYTSPSIRKVNTTDAMKKWWVEEVEKAQRTKVVAKE